MAAISIAIDLPIVLGAFRMAPGGGHAHSRMREVWLGGATDDVIAETELPVLLPH